jgi:hypothetical protein
VCKGKCKHCPEDNEGRLPTHRREFLVLKADAGDSGVFKEGNWLDLSTGIGLRIGNKGKLNSKRSK